MLLELRSAEEKPSKLRLGLLQETLQAECLELLGKHRKLVPRLLRGGPTRDLSRSTMCLMLALLGGATSRGYNGGVQTSSGSQNQSFPSPSQLPLFTIVSYWPVRSQQGVWKR